MEHRYSQRVRNDAKVFIYERGIPTAIGRCKNSSRYGMYIETDHAVYPNQPIEVEVIRGQRRESKSQRVKCYVVHIAKNGFGIELSEEHLNMFCATASMRADESDDLSNLMPTAQASQF